MLCVYCTIRHNAGRRGEQNHPVVLIHSQECYECDSMKELLSSMQVFAYATEYLCGARREVTTFFLYQLTPQALESPAYLPARVHAVLE